MKPHDHHNEYKEIFASEALRGNIVHWKLHWILYSIVLLLSLSVYFIQGIEVGKYGIILSSSVLIYNSLISLILRNKKAVGWIGYSSVSINIVALTIYNYLDASLNSSLTPVTTAALFLYPVAIFLASLRMDKYLIIWATVLSIICMDGLYFVFYDSFDKEIARQLVSADILGQVYRTVYLAMSGVLMYTVPSTMRRLLSAQEKLAEENIIYRQTSERDELTGISNRLHLNKYLARSIATAKQSNYKIAILFFDLDSFKAINDTYGHDAGDFILKTVAHDISSTIRYGDLVARLGGDEFIVVVNHVDGLTGAQICAKRLHDIIKQPRKFNLVTFTIEASIGISIFPDDSEDIDKLIKLADEAMYQVKNSSKKGTPLS